MTLQDILGRLREIDRSAQALLADAGFTDYDGLGSQVCLNSDDLDSRYMHDRVEDLLDLFETLHEELQYLKSPVHGEHVLERLPDGRYGYYDGDGKMHVLTCGSIIEARTLDCKGHQCWVRTRIEHDGQDYFLWGHGSLPLQGLVVRERG